MQLGRRKTCSHFYSIAIHAARSTAPRLAISSFLTLHTLYRYLLSSLAVSYTALTFSLRTLLPRSNGNKERTIHRILLGVELGLG